MKLYQILPNSCLSEQQLEELNLRQSLAAGAVGLVLASGALATKETPNKTFSGTIQNQKVEKIESRSIKSDIDYVLAITQKYKSISKLEADEIVKIAKKYEKDTFPKLPDILAIIGIESSFQEDSISNLKSDPAIGLMQVRPGVNGLNKSVLNSIDGQIKSGVDILHGYYKRIGNKDDAVHSYNVGIGNFKKGKNLNAGYVLKWKKELQNFK